MRAARSRLRASQVMAPMVPGAYTNRKVCRRRGRAASACASSVETAMPDRLSSASDGWQTCDEIRISSSSSPGSTSSP